MKYLLLIALAAMYSCKDSKIEKLSVKLAYEPPVANTFKLDLYKHEADSIKSVVQYHFDKCQDIVLFEQPVLEAKARSGNYERDDILAENTKLNRTYKKHNRQAKLNLALLKKYTDSVDIELKKLK